MEQPLGLGVANTAAFLETISLDRVTLHFCDRFDSRSRRWNPARHAHPYFELIFFLEGRADIDAGQESLGISLFDVLIYPPGLEHLERLAGGRAQEVICLWADLGSCARFDHAIRLEDSTGAFRQLFEAILRESAGHRRFREEILRCHLCALVWQLRQHFCEPAAEAHSRLERCLNYIQEHYARDFSMGVLAKLAFVSPSYLFRLFRRNTGMTPVNYRNTVRVEKAKLLLLDRTLKMEDIADRVGFGDPRYFARVFRRVTGETPSGFRQRSGGR